MTIYNLDILLFLFGTSCSMSSSNCCFLTHIQVSQEAGQVVWYSHLFKKFPQFGDSSSTASCNFCHLGPHRFLLVYIISSWLCYSFKIVPCLFPSCLLSLPTHPSIVLGLLFGLRVKKSPPGIVPSWTVSLSGFIKKWCWPRRRECSLTTLATHS